MIKWENTGEILKRREDKKKGTGEAPGIAEVEVGMLSSKLFKCLRPTESKVSFLEGGIFIAL